MNPSPTYGGIQVQVKLSHPQSSLHMAFSSHGMPATPVQSSVGREYEGVNDFLVYMYVVQNMSQIYHCTKLCQEIANLSAHKPQLNHNYVDYLSP